VRIEANHILGAIAIGVGASLVMDLWKLFLKGTFGIPSLNSASRTPNPTQARLKSLVTHNVFGVGLYVCALAVSYVSIN
jgi:hypothetical protein